MALAKRSMIDSKRDSDGAAAQAGAALVCPSPLDEPALWRSQGAEWRQLFGSFHQLGVSFEWHDFELTEPIDWARSFHPGSLEVCLNLSGKGWVADGRRRLEFEEQTVGYYFTGSGRLEGSREPGPVHRFITIEFSPKFLAEQLGAQVGGLTRLVADIVQSRQAESAVGACRRLSSAQLEIVRSLQRPPVYAAAQGVWYRGKALELAAAFLYEPPPEAELFCHRQQHVASERVGRVVDLLRAGLAGPLSLDTIARAVGCSQFYLSRTFSREMGMTIPQYLRKLRMEKAAELLRTGQYNVTEAALEVGYSSLSHFSHTFHQTFGCCPGLYPAVRPPLR